MPAIITHDLFAEDIMDRVPASTEGLRAERDALALGSQGPDVFFFALSPSLRSLWGLGSRMHSDDPDKLLVSLIESASFFSGEAKAVASAYVRGFACHYLLDSAMHPFIYSQQYAISSAGVEGLDDRDGHEIHSEIESELDVHALTMKTGRTVADLNPKRHLLRASDETLMIISALWRDVIEKLYGIVVPSDAFAKSVRSYRTATSLLYSPRGIKRSLLGAIETTVRRHSFLRAMSHRNELLYTTPFGNETHEVWTNPYTGQTSTASFWNIYDRALDDAAALLPGLFDMSEEEIASITRGLDFNGIPTRPLITSVEMD